MKKAALGTTLIELLIVVLIVAAIAGLAVPSYLRMIEKIKVKDAQATLTIIYRAEGMYRLAYNTYGTLDQMVTGNYIDPNPNPDPNWTFSTSGELATAFEATASRNPGAGEFSEKTIKLNQDWTGNPIPGPPYNGKKFFGNHPLHD